MKYSWLFVAWCTVLVPLSNAEITEATPTETFPDFLKQGLEVYEALKSDVQRALGLQKYAEHLSTATTEVNLDEKVILEELDNAHDLVQECVDKAMMVVTLMKENCNAIVLALDPSMAGTDQQKLWAALKYFSGYKDTDESIEEVEGALLQVSNILHNLQMNLSCILEHEQVHFIDRKVANATYYQMVYMGVGTLSLLFRPIGPLVATSFVIGTTEFNSFEEMMMCIVGTTMATATNVKGQVLLYAGFIAGFTIGSIIEDKSIEEDFRQQQETINGYIQSFETMSAQTKALQERLNVKRQQLTDIRAKLNTTSSLVGVDLNSLPLLHFDIIYKNARALVEAFETILENKAELKMLGQAST